MRQGWIDPRHCETETPLGALQGFVCTMRTFVAVPVHSMSVTPVEDVDHCCQPTCAFLAPVTQKGRLEAEGLAHVLAHMLSTTTESCEVLIVLGTSRMR